MKINFPLVFSMIFSISIALFIFTIMGFTKRILDVFQNKIKKMNCIDYSSLEKKIQDIVLRSSEKNEKKIVIAKLTDKKIPLQERIKLRIFDVVKNENHAIGFLPYTISTFILFLLGYIIGLKFNNIGVSIILGFIGIIVPYLYLIYKINTVIKDRDKKLLVVMANLSSAVLNNDTFEKSVEQILDTIPEPLYKHFKLFRDSVILFSSDKIEAMKELSQSINNYYFQEFMQMAIQAESGESGLKYTMKAIPSDYKRYLDLNSEYEKKVHGKNMAFLTIILCFPFILAFLRVMSKKYYMVLIEHPLGKLLLLIVMIIFVIGSFLYRHYNKPIKLDL